DVEDLHDARVVQRCREARLLEEHGEECAVVRQLRTNALQRDELFEAVEAGDAREVHLGHAARAERTQDLVAAEPLAGGEPRWIAAPLSLSPRVRPTIVQWYRKIAMIASAAAPS